MEGLWRRGVWVCGSNGKKEAQEWMDVILATVHQSSFGPALKKKKKKKIRPDMHGCHHHHVSTLTHPTLPPKLSPAGTLTTLAHGLSWTAKQFHETGWFD